jgi:hypothetical protein
MGNHGGSSACRDWIAAVVAGRRPATMPGVDAAAIAAVAAEEQVAGLLADALAQAADGDAIPGLIDALQRSAKARAMQELAQQAQARLALAALEEAGIAALVLKGGALAYWLYDDPELRPRSDLDLLVATTGDATRAIDALAGAGYALVAGVGVDDVAGFEVALRRDSRAGSHVIDLHWRLLNSSFLAAGFGFDELRAQSIPLPSLHPSARGLGRAHALAHALLHRVTNMPSGQQDKLIWLFDIHLLADGCDGSDWASFLRLCRDRRIATPVVDGLEACAAAFGTAIPAEVERELRRLAAGESWKLEGLDQGAMDRAHLAALPWRERLGWLRRKLFPSREFMRHRYGAAGWPGLARAYAARWWTGAKRGLGI